MPLRPTPQLLLGLTAGLLIGAVALRRDLTLLVVTAFLTSGVLYVLAQFLPQLPPTPPPPGDARSAPAR